jgi:hypothetical protein
MGATGTTLLDFGSFPGASDASVAVTGQASLLAGSLVEAWLFPATTADHSADEHVVETITVIAGNVIAGTGFTIYGVNTSQLNEPLYVQDVGQESIGGAGTRLYGKWNVAWAWN